MHTDITHSLNTCDREQIHRIGSIQGHGYLFGFHFLDRRVCAASQNVSELVNADASQVFGRRLSDVLGEEMSEQILAMAREMRTDDSGIRQFDLHAPQDPTQALDAHLYQSTGLYVLELEKRQDDAMTDRNRMEKIELNFLSELQQPASVENAARHLCRYVRELTGFERVMMYKFLPNWDGEVIAESKNPESHSFFHHRFPATDIPLPARELYLRNRTRWIRDAGTEPVPVQCARLSPAEKGLDLSDSKLRAVSPVHLEYLKNMGVVGSYSVAVVVEDRLWGLIACHAQAAIPLSLRTRACSERLASALASVVKLIEKNREQNLRIGFQDQLQTLLYSLRLHTDPIQELFRHHHEMCQAFAATGMAMVTQKEVQMAGLTPMREQLREIADWVLTGFEHDNRSFQAYENLPIDKPEWQDLRQVASGLLAVRLNHPEDGVFLFFRPEVSQLIQWGGDPRKTLEKRGYRGPINPRQSFETWAETIRMQSAPWRHYEIQGILFLRDFVFDALARKERLLQEMAQRLQMLNKHA